MSHIYDSSIKPLVIGDKTYHDVTVDVAAVEGKTNKHWWIVFSIALTFLWGLGCIALCLQEWNMGIKQNSWLGLGYHKLCLVGIGHAGTLISAVLLLFRQRWRMAINRSVKQ
jgi:molybdopterin-containing oxidoreductase family membrane subunit